MDTVNNISLPAGLSLNSAVSIIPTSPHKGGQVPNKVNYLRILFTYQMYVLLAYFAIVTPKSSFTLN